MKCPASSLPPRRLHHRGHAAAAGCNFNTAAMRRFGQNVAGRLHPDAEAGPPACASAPGASPGLHCQAEHRTTCGSITSCKSCYCCYHNRRRVRRSKRCLVWSVNKVCCVRKLRCSPRLIFGCTTPQPVDLMQHASVNHTALQ